MIRTLADCPSSNRNKRVSSLPFIIKLIQSLKKRSSSQQRLMISQDTTTVTSRLSNLRLTPATINRRLRNTGINTNRLTLSITLPPLALEHLNSSRILRPPRRPKGKFPNLRRRQRRKVPLQLTLRMRVMTIVNTTNSTLDITNSTMLNSSSSMALTLPLRLTTNSTTLSKLQLPRRQVALSRIRELSRRLIRNLPSPINDDRDD